MKLRTKLVVAFLVMAVLPLTGLTFYTYVTSEQAARRAVEAESRVLAGEMGRRMELVAADLSRIGDNFSLKPLNLFFKGLQIRLHLSDFCRQPVRFFLDHTSGVLEQPGGLLNVRKRFLSG